MTSGRIPVVAGWTLDDVEGALRALEPDQFASHLVLDRTPWLWSERAAYTDWKSELARELQVDPYSLLVVGSAATGVTLNPKKSLFRGFQTASDVDVAVVSHYHFELGWKTLRELGSRGEIPTKQERRGRKQHREYLVFDGTIATDWILPHLPFGTKWSAALRSAEAGLPEPGHAVKARIYRDVEALRAYQVRNIARLRDQLLVIEDDEDFAEFDGAPLDTVDVKEEE